MKMNLPHLLELCREIDAGYAAEKSGYDDDMFTLLIMLGDSVDEIMNLADLVEKARPHVLKIACDFHHPDNLAARQWIEQGTV